MNVKLNLLGALIALSCGAAHAGTVQIGGTAVAGEGQVTSRSGVCTVNFNGGNAANACGAVYTQSGGAAPAASNFPTGSTSSHAAPAGDTSAYLTVGPTDGTPITVTLATAANYFGFYGGSVDTYNLVQFFLNGVIVDSFNGSTLATLGGTLPNGTAAAYFNYFPGSFYDQIVYSSTQNAFETDNHAFGVASPISVPEPTSIALLGLGALALAARRRKA